MDIVTSIAALRERLAVHRRAGRSIGLVPTMGYLHAGHMQLVARSRADSDITVVSLFVNPLQFGAGEDLARYPRDLDRDAAMLRAAKADYLFAPGVDDMYPRPMETVVDVPALGAALEGSVRPGHFAGVATVVTKLFNIVQPDSAYFGEKDYQQVVIIRRMVADLALPVRVVPVPTVREADGLALSSRNVYLDAQERQAATIVPKTLAEAARLYQGGLRDVAAFEAALRRFIAAEPRAEAEIVALRDPETLAEIAGIGDRPALLLLCIRIGKTRLIDNGLIGREMAENHRAA